MDKHLRVMKKFTNEELSVIVEILKEKGWISEDLSSNERFRNCGENYSECVDLIAKEIQAFGGNTLVNLVRGGGPRYKEVLCDVCEKLDVNFNEGDKVRDIEVALLTTVLEKIVDEMSEEDLRKVLAALNVSCSGSDFKAEGLAALITIFRAGGFKSYELTMIIVNSLAKLFIGRGLSLAANAAINKALGVVTGPVGIALTSLWLIADITGPAYRVTVPVVIYIAALRMAIRLRKKEERGKAA